jgi:enterochelin esterase family protein
VQWADRLIVEGRMPPVILAIVDGLTRLGGSQYVDSIHNGAYATYVVRDVIGHVDAHYRTLAGEGGRAVFGKSSGGFGALHLSLAYPGTFAAFASHSGDAYFPVCYPFEWPAALIALEQAGSIAAFVDAFATRSKPPQAWFATINQLGMAAAYSPRAAERWAIDLPWDAKTGERREDVFARWLAYDPCERVASGRDALARLRLRYLDCGIRDEYGLQVGARVFTQRVRDLGLEVRHEEFDDDHRNVGYRHEVSLPALAAVLDRG